MSAGDFGDGGSCYWGGRDDARAMLADNGAWAIRFYDAADKGYARAWVYQADADLLIVWNGYGKPFANPTLTIARIVAAHFNRSYKKIDLSNNGTDTGTLYINSGIGYAIADADELERTHDFDFEWDDPHAHACSNCGDYVHEDSVYYGADDQPYCESCYNQTFGSCADCGNTFDLDSLYYAGGDDYCEHCLDRLFSRCDNCEEYVAQADIIERDEHWYCADCDRELNTE